MIYRNNDLTKVFVLLLISMALASCGAGKRATSKGGEYSTSLQDDIIQYGKKYLGKPYRYAGRGPNSFDCSGYTSFVFKKFGYRLSSSSEGQDKQATTIARKEKLRKGDLVFFEGNRRNGRVGHVGIVTEAFSNGHFKFIHSSTTNGVIISSSREPYYANRYLRGGRILEENASYVTRQNMPTTEKQLTAAKENKRQTISAIPEVSPPKKGNTEVAALTNEHAGSRSYNEPVVVVQTDPNKNPPLSSSANGSRGPQGNESSVHKTKRDIAIREEEISVPPSPAKTHTVQMGETLFSISRLYGCSVEQLKAWNPQLGSILKAGETLRVYRN